MAGIQDSLGPRWHVSPRPPPPSLSLSQGRWRLARKDETQQHLSTLPTEPQLSCAAPSWASIVRDGVCSRRPLPPQLAPLPAESPRMIYSPCTSNALLYATLQDGTRYPSPVLSLPPPPQSMPQPLGDTVAAVTLMPAMSTCCHQLLRPRTADCSR